MFTVKNSYLFKSLYINYLRYKHKKYGKCKQVHISAGNCRKNPDAFPTPPIIQDKNKTPVPTKKKTKPPNTKIFIELFYRETLPDAKSDNVFIYDST